MNMVNGDRTITPILKVLVFVSALLFIGLLLNGISSIHEKKMIETERQTMLRISLIRQEYERKLAEKDEKAKLSCDQRISELKSFLNTKNKETAEQLEAKYKKDIKNMTDEITRLKVVAEKCSTNTLVGKGTTTEPKLSLFAEIERQLSEIKKELLGKKEKATNNEKEAEQHNDEKKILEDIRKKLEQAQKSNQMAKTT